MNREKVFADRVAENGPEYVARWSQLRDRILAHGGEEVVPHFGVDPHLDQLIDGGVLWLGNVEFDIGEPSNCHENSLMLLALGKCDAVWTGYALNGGLWRQHSAGLNLDGPIIETTCEREEYFGITWLTRNDLEIAVTNKRRVA